MSRSNLSFSWLCVVSSRKLETFLHVDHMKKESYVTKMKKGYCSIMNILSEVRKVDASKHCLYHFYIHQYDNSMYNHGNLERQ